MRQTLTSLKAEWINVGSSKSEPDVRIPPLNIMAVLTLDTVNREWQQQQNLPPAEQSVALRQDLREIEDGAIEKQSEVLTLLPHSMWRDSFQFDVKYDLA